MFPGVAEVGQVISSRMEAVLVGRPGDGVGDAFPLVRVGTAPHVVARLGHVARVGDAVLTGSDAVGGLITKKKKIDAVSRMRFMDIDMDIECSGKPISFTFLVKTSSLDNSFSYLINFKS